MNWKNLTTKADIENALSRSFEKPVLIFKHSTRCSISAASLDRVERRWESDTENFIEPYFLDLIRHREVSNEVANKTGVYHQSPQAILLMKGKTVYDASHFSIDFEEIKELALKEAVNN